MSESLAAEPERIVRFVREAETLASLNHSNIAIVHDFQQAEQRHFLVMEFVAGETLADRLRRGPVPLDEALQMARQIAEALEAAHQRGIIHRDLKPANIKIDTDGFEPAILRGAKGVLSTARPVVFYEWHPDFYSMAGENDTSHADLLMDLGYDGFMFFSNAGELLMRVRRPAKDVLESLARFSRARRHIDDWQQRFPTEQRADCSECGGE